MGWEARDTGHFYDDRIHVMPIVAFCPCTNWEHAGWVWDRLVKLGYNLSLEHINTDSCCIWLGMEFERAEVVNDVGSAQAAIVACALAVFGYDVEVKG